MGFVELEVVPFVPFTRRSKSSSPLSAPFDASKPETPPKDMKSSLRGACEPRLVPMSSWRALVCSASTREERLLIRSMKDWNCFRSRRGPRAMVQSIGKIFPATNSRSATAPTRFKTFRAATITAGSFVLIALISGTIFSCIVYLSNALELVAFAWVVAMPFRSSSPEPSGEPPQSITNASNPRTLIPRLLVLLKTVAMTGKSSFLMVLKSRIGNAIGKLLRAESTSACVGDSMEMWIIGRISILISMLPLYIQSRAGLSEMKALTIFELFP